MPRLGPFDGLNVDGSPLKRGKNPFARSTFKIVNKVVVYVLRSETGQLYVGLTKDLPLGDCKGRWS